MGILLNVSILILGVQLYSVTHVAALPRRFLLNGGDTWSSWEHYAACTVSCLSTYRERTRGCCETGNNMNCLLLPWDELRPLVGSCEVSTSPTPPPETSTTHVTTIQSLFCAVKDSVTCSVSSDDPVCASDGTVYRNECEFAKAKCDNSGLLKLNCSSTTVSHLTSAGTTTPPTTDGSGTVPSPTMDPIMAAFCQNKNTISCGTTLDPICGSNKLFYKNKCEFTKDVCENPLLVVRDVHFCIN